MRGQVLTETFRGGTPRHGLRVLCHHRVSDERGPLAATSTTFVVPGAIAGEATFDWYAPGAMPVIAATDAPPSGLRPRRVEDVAA